MLVIVAETDSRFSTYVIASETYHLSTKLEGGNKKIIGISCSLLKTSATHDLVLVAVGCYDKCQSQFYRITVAKDLKKSKNQVIAV